ncbi:MAG: DUF1549 and DUF1553 domain-containing protein [Planctomycetaceae bacterium]|nr:DUF1549 and DUF1553 domain-containing protein [Planctomycetaceae bacterium]
MPRRCALFLLAVLACLPSLASAQTAWPFTPLGDPPLPQVSDTAWCRNGIDHFILGSLEAAGLTPATAASRETLLRRVYFDLIGLPPTPQERKAFLADTSASAYQTVVDRLLRDPRHGERWARFWLDLARYADTAGYEGDPDLPHTWRYRDYVIDSLNRDKPYDLFIREQLAGDEFENVLGAGELPLPNPERVVAMTFLRLAPFTEPRGDETRHEMLSEMTSTVGSVFLGLTVGCAKCHDHKHDDIPTRDFYRLKAFFATVAIPPPLRGDGFQIGGGLPARFYRKNEQAWAEATRKAHAAEIDTAKTELAALKSRLSKSLNATAGFALQSMGGKLGNNYFFDVLSVNDGKRHTSIVSSNGSTWSFETDGHRARQLESLSGTNSGHWFADLVNPTSISLGQHTAGSGTPRQSGHEGTFGDVLVYDHPLSSAERLQLHRYIREKYDVASQPPTDPPRMGLRFWMNAADLDGNPSTPNPQTGTAVARWADPVSGIALVQDNKSLQPRLATLGRTKAAGIAFDKSFLKGSVAASQFLEDQQGSIVVVFSATHQEEGYGLEVGGGGMFLSTAIYPSARKSRSLEAVINDSRSLEISEVDRRRYRYLSTRGQAIAQDLKRLQPLAMSLRHTFGPPYEPGVPTSRVMVRGEYNNPGEVVEPGFLSCITGHQKPAPIRLDPFKRWPTRSRRMALARWIASKNNPLTARVMVNRLWHWHFGQGIVSTPSDFGSLRTGPSHEQLLDWLARRFLDGGWSLRAVHRLMVLSAAYQQSSLIAHARASRLDPDNRLLWRFQRRRLEAEAVRDSVLAASGRLNPEHYGLPIFPQLPDDVGERVKWKQSKWHTQYDKRSRKRSIYIYQQRSLSMPFMQAFDSLVCEETRPKRRTSITPLQALAMYNGQFVNEEAEHFSARVRKQGGADPAARIRQAFLIAFTRLPTPEETTRLKEFLIDSGPPDQALVGLCRVLLNSNEFVYID